MNRPWQVLVFDHGLKKRQKLELLLRQLGSIEGQRCLLVTCGDNNGAINLKLRKAGGQWTFMELEPDGIPAMCALLDQLVHTARPDRLPADDEAFDVVVSVDVHEHLDDPMAFAAEIARVVAPSGRAIVTTPSGGRRRPVNIVKRWLGMDNATYGHHVDGIGILQHEGWLRGVGLDPIGRSSYSRAITETIELALNVLYVKILGKGGNGRIAPRTEADVGGLGPAFRLYQIAFPVLRAIAALDRLIPFPGYAVSVVAIKPAPTRSDSDSP